MHENRYDVVIVGGAAVGSATAYFLMSNPDFHGRVLVVEKDPSYQYCATTLSAASIRHQFSTPENIRMSLFGTEFLRAFARRMAVNGDTPDPAFVEGGYLFLATPGGGSVLQSNVRVQQQEGADIELLSVKQLKQRYPWMNTSGLAGGALGVSGEGWLDAYGMMQGMRRKAIALGATYCSASVAGLLHEGDTIKGVSLCNGEQVHASTVINAAGTGAKTLSASVGIELPVESRKRSVFYFKSPAALKNCPMVIDPSGAYFRPEGEGFITGISPEVDDDPECYDYDVQHELFENLLWPLLAERVPGFEALRLQRSWAGHYDMNLIDQNVIIGEHPAIKNLLFANGFSGHGMQQAPAVGRALSELIVYHAFKTLDLSRLGWNRIIEQRPLIEQNVV